MPVYAEIVVRSETEEPAVDVDGRLDDAILLALREDAPENIGEPQPRQRLMDVIRQEIARQLGPDADAMLRAGDPGDPVEFIAKVISRVRDAFGGGPLRSLDRDTLKRAIRDAIRKEASRRDMRLEPPAEPTPTLWAYPLGVLATDHTGYLSYDLSRLPATVQQAVVTAVRARRLDPAAALDVTISIYPMGLKGMVFDALSQGRFTLGAIVARLELARPLIPYAVLNLALPAMQSPSLEDWRLSPGSFATNPGSLIGADGCESILPANVSLQEFYLYQVVRLTDVAPPVAAVTAGQVQLGVVNEYRVAWHSLGHSLGQILYSLPLAPGESVNLAVIDWTRRDEAQRKERTTVDEQLIHNEHRDRVISETVDAAVREYQHGSSFMGGGAGAVGISYGPVSAGIAGSLGGSTSNSSGNRSVVASTVQKVSDNITQVSSASRELQSTIVVQSTQSEKETIETRTVANYNHSHALTILYYEVLRHFRVSTELVRRRPAVLVKIKTDWFAGTDAEKNARDHRKPLESALLDPKVAAGFDALDRFEHRRQVAIVLGLPPPPPPPLQPPPPPPLAAGDREFVFFTFEMKTGGMFTQQMDDHGKRVEVVADLVGINPPVNLVNPAGDKVLNQRGSFRQPSAINMFVAVLPVPLPPVRWSTISAVFFFINPQGDSEQKVSFEHIKVIGTDVTGATEVLIDQGYGAGHLIITDEGGNMALPTRRPPPPPAPSGPPAEEIADELNRTRLLAHLKDHAAHYSRAIYFSREGLERAAELDAIKLADGSNVLEKVENRPIEVIGEYMAFPSTDSAWEDKIVASLDEVEPDDVIVDERLVALPTRGVFAEAKLGRCNASELIDNTRFWDWQQSPIPHMAPEIAPITAVTPQPQPQNLGATPFPASIVNIVNPPNAPDPTGMSAALSLLATPNIFRDMSGRSETADILKNLADNAVKIAAVASAARAGQSGSGASSGGGSHSTGTGGGGLGGPRAMPNQPSVINRDLQDLGNVLGRAQADNLITPEAARDVYAKALLGFAVSDAGAGDAGGSSVSPFSEKFYPTEMRPSATLNAQLATAMQTVRGTLSDTNKTRLDNVSIIVFKLTPSGNMDYAGVRETDMFFSGSLLKVSLLYASFELVARVNKLAQWITAGSTKDFFVKVNQDFDPKIANAVPKITPGPWRKVQFDGALAATADASGKFQVTMSPRHDQDLRSIFNNQLQNVGARECMRRLGFSYVNGALEAAGFLGLVTETGIWMATDFIQDDPPGPGNWPSFNIPVVTNGTSSAAMTTLTMANLLNKIHRGELIDAASSQTMRDIFATGGAWLSTLADPNAFSFTADGAKVGHSSSASARVGSVMSEAVFLKRKSDSVPFAAVWQNVPDPLGAEPIYQVIDELIKNWP